MIITNEFLEKMRTSNGGYTKAQMLIVAYFLNTTISPSQIYPANWKARLVGKEISDLWAQKLFQAKEYSSKDLFNLGASKCTGLSKERADILMPIKNMKEKKRKAKNKRRAKKRLQC
jgi:hypothetical protein